MPRTKRAPNGAGSVIKRKGIRNGKEYTWWEGRYTVGVDPKTGKQKQRTVTGKTQKEVAEKIRAATYAIDQGTYQEPNDTTLGEWLDLWLKDYLMNVKPRTLESYQCQVKNHIKPELGDIKLSKLKAPAIQHFYNGLINEKGLSAKTVKIIHGVLHESLDKAVAAGLIHSNPADSCTLPRIQRRELDVLDDDAISSFLKAVKGHRWEALYVVDLFTGLRKGELLGLTWDCVDFEKGTILVNKQLSYFKKDGHWVYDLAPTKNGKGRKLSVPPFVLDVLKQQKAKQALWEKESMGSWSKWNGYDLVFTDPLGSHLMSQSVYRDFKKLVTSIGSPGTRLHDLRHSYAVAAIKSGDDIKTVQGNLGHATASFTLDVYGHLTEQMKQESAARMEQFIQKVAG